jgi:hypothetical protein
MLSVPLGAILQHFRKLPVVTNFIFLLAVSFASIFFSSLGSMAYKIALMPIEAGSLWHLTMQTHSQCIQIEQ